MCYRRSHVHLVSLRYLYIGFTFYGPDIPILFPYITLHLSRLVLGVGNNRWGDKTIILCAIFSLNIIKEQYYDEICKRIFIIAIWNFIVRNKKNKIKERKWKQHRQYRYVFLLSQKQSNVPFSMEYLESLYSTQFYMLDMGLLRYHGSVRFWRRVKKSVWIAQKQSFLIRLKLLNAAVGKKNPVL